MPIRGKIPPVLRPAPLICRGRFERGARLIFICCLVPTGIRVTLQRPGATPVPIEILAIAGVTETNLQP